jgi:hypothetical protein
MSGQPAVNGASAPRVLVLDDGKVHDVFDVLDVIDGIVRARSPYLFEIGEEMRVRIEADGAVSEAIARVRAHVDGDPDASAKITELELLDQTEPRPR